MKITPFKMNLFMMFRLPAAYLCGVRLKEISEKRCEVTVTKRWINQNPFSSMYFAVQAMAAEFSTGALVNFYIERMAVKPAMLIISNKASYHKKALGRISFVCEDAGKIPELLEKAVKTGQSQTFWLKSEGKDQAGDVVSEMEFEWSVKARPAGLKK